jgi:hypothetical protein
MMFSSNPFEALAAVTIVPDLAPAKVVERYKGLADIERGFKVLKSGIEIALIFQRLPKRIKAHALICFLALVLHRVLRMQLKDVNRARTRRSVCWRSSSASSCMRSSYPTRSAPLGWASSIPSSARSSRPSGSRHPPGRALSPPRSTSNETETSQINYLRDLVSNSGDHGDPERRRGVSARDVGLS